MTETRQSRRGPLGAALLALCACGDGGGPAGPVPCNGDLARCGRRYDQLTFPGAHNAMAALEDGFTEVNANHRRGIAAQLDAGIRVLLLDVKRDAAGHTALCHGPCELGEVDHVATLELVGDFLDEHPGEVITVVYEDSLTPAEIAADFATADLTRLTYTHRGGPWPTLGEMVAADTRLVVTAENGGPPPDWLHHVWDLAWDTPYQFTSVDGMSCALNRGSTDNPLFQINHWLQTGIGLPSEELAAEANAFAVLDARARRCWAETGQRPNFLVVDFWEQGDLFAVVEGLDAVPDGARPLSADGSSRRRPPG